MEINVIITKNVDSIKKGYIVLGTTIIDDIEIIYIKKMKTIAMDK